MQYSDSSRLPHDKVKWPDKDGWGNLRRVPKYLKGTRHMNMMLTVNDLSIVKWWVDKSNWTRVNLKGHTGTMMTLGAGAIVSGS